MLDYLEQEEDKEYLKLYLGDHLFRSNGTKKNTLSVNMASLIDFPVYRWEGDIP